MITVQRKEIQAIPVLEMVEQERMEEQLPLAIFLHGITNQKEKGLEPGYEMARRGMRVLIPDAFLHGERKKEEYQGTKEMAFWNIVWHSIEELPYLADHYVTEKKALANRISVTGLSMGAITTCMALAKYPWIHSAGCLMGTPDPIGFTEWVLSSHWVEGMDPVDADIDEIDQLMAPFREWSLQDEPEKLAGRPFYIWHGTEDQSVPFEQMNAFVAKNEQEDYAANIKFEYGEGAGHKVPYEIFSHMADYLAAP